MLSDRVVTKYLKDVRNTRMNLPARSADMNLITLLGYPDELYTVRCLQQELNWFKLPLLKNNILLHLLADIKYYNLFLKIDENTMFL